MNALARLVLLYCLGACATASAATFTFRFNDGDGEGFNDTTPFTPVGGNTATTLGQARRNVLMEAGRIWGGLLMSNVPIVVDVQFNRLDCNDNSGILGSAGARTFFRNFADGFSPDTFFASALADSLAGSNLMEQTDDPDDPDIRATFNLSVDADSNCLRGVGFYYGFDGNEGTRIDALVVALHELSHGFGFVSEIDTSNGNGFKDGRFSSFVLKIFDEQLGRSWPMLSANERITSAVGNAGLTWNGSNVNARFTALAPGVSGQGRLRLFSPTPVSVGSSVSHWDRSATPNLLMEPNISKDLTSSVDVTVCALRDIGWRTTRCPDGTVTRGATPNAASQTVTVAEDTTVSLTLMATDTDGDPLTFNITTQPLMGTLSGNTAQRTYTPAANASGADSFTFTASDGGNSSSPATVTITITPVADLPLASDVSATANSGQGFPISLNGTDGDGDPLTFELLSSPANGALSGNGPVRLYTSNMGFVGTDTFTYRVRDATSVSAAATVTVNVVAAAGTASNTPAAGRRGGGGAMNELLLLGLALLAMAARFGRGRPASLVRVRQRARHRSRQ